MSCVTTRPSWHGSPRRQHERVRRRLRGAGRIDWRVNPKINDPFDELLHGTSRLVCAIVPRTKGVAVTVAEHMVVQIVSLCVLAASSVALIWYSYKDRPASQPAGDTIEQPPAPTPVQATIEHDRPADAGAWRLEALLEADRQMLRPRGEGRQRGIEEETP